MTNQHSAANLKDQETKHFSGHAPDETERVIVGSTKEN